MPLLSYGDHFVINGLHSFENRRISFTLLLIGGLLIRLIG